MPRLRLAAFALLALPAAATACLWDYDTLAQERGRFPSVLELLTGKYLRHSPAFYEWRAADRRRRLVADPTNLALHDDLVVALDRLGRFDEALKAAEAANAVRPGRYETESNWGTVLLHMGRLEDGLAHLDAAVRINPDAHFGREVYQQKLVRWMLAARTAGRTLPVSDVDPATDEEGRTKLRATDDWVEEAIRTDRAAALTAVLGMMRTGQHDHPVLLEALGRLLSRQHYDAPRQDAKRLAARAFLRAADVAPEPAAKRAYRGLAAAAVGMQLVGSDMGQVLSLVEVEQDLRRELADADAWFAGLVVTEAGWIAGGAADPDAAFARLYGDEPEAAGDGSTVPLLDPAVREHGPAVVVGGVCGGLTVLACLAAGRLAVRSLRRRVKIPAPGPAA